MGGRGGLCDVDQCCACSRPFPSSSVAETYCRCGKKYIGTREGIRIVFAKYGDGLFAPSYGQLNGIFGYHTDKSSEEKVPAVITPRARPTTSTAADINDFHCPYGHTHEDLLRKTAK